MQCFSKAVVKCRALQLLAGWAWSTVAAMPVTGSCLHILDKPFEAVALVSSHGCMLCMVLPEGCASLALLTYSHIKRLQRACAASVRCAPHVSQLNALVEGRTLYAMHEGTGAGLLFAAVMVCPGVV
jgi:hypothetical protein